MAPKRPAEAHLIRILSPNISAVLVVRAEGSEAQRMAIAALEIDAGWNHDDAVTAVMTSRIESGRYYKVPDRDQAGTWIMVRSLWPQNTLRRGATPGVLFVLAEDQQKP